MATNEPNMKNLPTLRYYNDLHAGYGTIRIHNYDDPFFQVFYKNIQTGQQSRFQYVVRDYPRGTFRQDILRYVVEPQGFIRDMHISMDDSVPSQGMDRVALVLKEDDWEQPRVQTILEGLLESIAKTRIVSCVIEGNLSIGGSKCNMKPCSDMSCYVYSYIIFSGVTGYTIIIRSSSDLDRVPFGLQEVLQDSKCIVIGQDVQKDLQALERPYGSDHPMVFNTRQLIHLIINDPNHRTFRGDCPKKCFGADIPTGLGAQQFLITGEDHKPWDVPKNIGLAKFAKCYNLNLLQAVKTDGPWRDPHQLYHWTNTLAPWQIKYMAIDGLCPVLMLWTALTIHSGDLPLTIEGLVCAARRMLTETLVNPVLTDAISEQRLSVLKGQDGPGVCGSIGQPPREGPLQVTLNVDDEERGLLGQPTETDPDVPFTEQEICSLLKLDDDSSRVARLAPDAQYISLDDVKDARIRDRMLGMGLRAITYKKLDMWRRTEKQRRKRSSKRGRGEEEASV